MAAGSGPPTPELPRGRRLVCVEYPGVVRDPEKALLSLGGEEALTRVYADPSRRLELYFRPKDPYCHPVCANRFPASSMLLRVKRRTRRKRAGAGGERAEEAVSIQVEVLGIVSTVYKFQGMSDFQFLAAQSCPGGAPRSLYDRVRLLQPEKEAFFMGRLPLYIPPPIFSRLDTPVDYYYRPETQHREGYHHPLLSSENLIGLSRARRPHNAIFVTFEEEEVPTKPLEAAQQTWRRVCSNTLDHRAEEELQKLFEVRPVWSRNAVKANISIHPDKLKFLLPYLAYYMLTGPWRSLWVRFGYDPRKHPEAKVYQVLDFRIRCGMKYGYAPNELPVKAKRSTYNYSLPITLKKPGLRLHLPRRLSASLPADVLPALRPERGMLSSQARLHQLPKQKAKSRWPLSLERRKKKRRKRRNSNLRTGARTKWKQRSWTMSDAKAFHVREWTHLH
ncbi:general transcription factor 3C polypeptide 5 isoform X2 [Anolis sagrei]|uniref:general transcription factor 3C polypeptide 5 isoform X2 n=1 Tax=Anolis sagrei TaxID=38937 RepID=UPI0035216C12